MIPRIAIASLFLCACTIEVDVPKPELHVQCVQIVLPGGQTSTVCPDGGTGDDGSTD
jgi:hypothetical protein